MSIYIAEFVAIVVTHSIHIVTSATSPNLFLFEVLIDIRLTSEYIEDVLMKLIKTKPHVKPDEGVGLTRLPLTKLHRPPAA